MKNLKIDKKERKAELELNRDFYPENVLRKALRDFGEVFDADVEYGEEKIVVNLRLKTSKVNIEEAMNEFVNYLLAEVKNDMVRV
jgi:hypothetical protein